MIFESKEKRKTEKMSEVSTEEILNQIQEAPGMFAKTRLDEIQSIHFEEYLKNLMKKYHCEPGQLIIRSCLSKPFVYQILNGERMPGRDVVLRICFALKTEVDEAQHLLMLAEKGCLYPKIRRDAAILCCMEEKKSLEYTDQFLEEHGEKKLL